MSVEAFLMGKGKLDGTGARLAYEDRWMVFSGVANHWVVYQRRNNTQKTKVIYAGDPEGALGVLERGFALKTDRETIAEDCRTSLSEANDSPRLNSACNSADEANLWLPAYWFFCQPVLGNSA